MHACVYAVTGERERARVARLYELSFLLSLSPPHKTAGELAPRACGRDFCKMRPRRDAPGLCLSSSSSLSWISAENASVLAGNEQ